MRRELESKGHQFVSDTDTEVILHLYEEEGPDCVKRLNGMFAFAICDLRSGTPTLFVARDHFGVKPFYYFHQGKRLAFASEIKALLQVPGIDAELDPQSLAPVSDFSVGARSQDHVSRNSSSCPQDTTQFSATAN